MKRKVKSFEMALAKPRTELMEEVCEQEGSLLSQRFERQSESDIRDWWISRKNTNY